MWLPGMLQPPEPLAVDDRYRLKVLTRCRVAGLRLVPGQLLFVPRDKLRVAAHLTRCKTARPV